MRRHKNRLLVINGAGGDLGDVCLDSVLRHFSTCKAIYDGSIFFVVEADHAIFPG